MITAAKVPPNTINIGGIRNNASKDPPSIKKEPNMETIPNIKPFTVPSFLIINNPSKTLEVSLMQVDWIAAAYNPDSANQ